MNEEKMKEIVKAAFYGHEPAEIAELEEISEEEVRNAIAWGESSSYKAELEERWKELNAE